MAASLRRTQPRCQMLGLPCHLQRGRITPPSSHTLQGTYYACFRGVGQGANPYVGWSNYGSLGSYKISIAVAGAVNHPKPDSCQALPPEIPLGLAGFGDPTFYAFAHSATRRQRPRRLRPRDGREQL